MDSVTEWCNFIGVIKKTRVIKSEKQALFVPKTLIFHTEIVNVFKLSRVSFHGNSKRMLLGCLPNIRILCHSIYLFLQLNNLSDIFMSLRNIYFRFRNMRYNLPQLIRRNEQRMNFIRLLRFEWISIWNGICKLSFIAIWALHYIEYITRLHFIRETKVYGVSQHTWTVLHGIECDKNKVKCNYYHKN